ncbi:hypothetical protein BRADI_2g42233v3 [Brachypodium distachyon]|uniref:MADS-box domain-containing protein n=1 Tax=Brachypodium distachyon TaxID=15368 RepID=A0A0Q3IRP6_BRADI|nr:hypothetical protein BRADI_2g42233v3 [Brachypodium distachyon]
MTRKKVTLKRIPNDAARRATFRNRLKDLVKKASELATLYNGKACVIVYGEGEMKHEMWPSVAEAVPILHRYKAMPDIGQCKKTEQIYKARRENHELHTASLVHKAMLGRLPGLKGLTFEEVTNVG